MNGAAVSGTAAPTAGVRCRVCGHRIWSPDSIAAGIGLACRREAARIARAAQQAVGR
ncbi:DUF6011 domain-containing protein [Nocardioides bruguierae]|uniref:DUF6011 domain-containing protein n=1 Tax=Nocardioides bruguierae TaxID=2945102 RepID=UPI0035582D08